ncbi:MAG TPA: 4-(cytidine 5'-diphospho)-2-C-methyl-D-erythritol kinase [Chitinophagaceae bacterium]|nr:4-(cytidine 5'-diphospho)-2-C-methyl-D-erythritol kinase [Chitinophagaceae bacterium]
MIVFPNCKINLGLNVLQKRSDGFHELETVFYPLAVHDILEIVFLKKLRGQPGIPFSVSGLKIDGKQNSNLCIQALKLLIKKIPHMPSVQLHLHKVIPTGSGLGGGSSDAAFTLKVLNEIFGLDLSKEQLIKYAAQIGSDCPFFIINKPCFSKGRGELLEEIDLDLSPYKIVLANPGIAVSTREAFTGITPALPEVSVREIIKKPIEAWKNELKNDFEKTIFSQYPGIAKIKDEMYNAGALYASMSGSGSTVFGIFSKQQSPAISFPSNYFVRELNG